MKRHLCGAHAVQEALASNPRALALVYVTDDSPRALHRDAIVAAERAGVPVETREPGYLDALARGIKHQGIIAVAGTDYPYLDLDGLLRQVGDAPLLVALDEITDVHNFGAIVRSAVAFGAAGVITLRDRAAPVTPAVVRASAGATEHARIARVTNLVRALEQLAERGFTSVGLAAEAERPVDALDLRGPIVLVIGSEGRGLRRLVRERCTTLGSIPQLGPIASLNASVAAGVALYEATRQRRVHPATVVAGVPDR